MQKRIFVNSDFKGMVTCPGCGSSGRKDFSKFIKHQAEVRLKYKCKCGHVSSVILERRRSKRKKVLFKGHLIVDKERYPMKVTDISKHGLKLMITGKMPVIEREDIEIEFTLDDHYKTTVLRAVHINNVIPPDTIKCDFLSHDHHGSLGKYFMCYY